MGVTVVTVNNWIKEGRIKGVIKEGNTRTRENPGNSDIYHIIE
nr:hypothetical protein [Geobacillus kaustophilus]